MESELDAADSLNISPPITITLEHAEYHFLLTVLRASANILHAMAGLKKTLPDAIDLAITPEVIQDIGVLADRIEQSAKTSERAE